VAMIRDMRHEEEFNLFYQVLAAQASPDAFVNTIRSGQLPVMRNLHEGRKHLFWQCLAILEARNQWDVLFQFCKEALSKKEEDGSSSFLASDRRVWRCFIAAAERQRDRSK
jgi:N-terminal acetyltransferase B complex non-catalytic subunit